MRVSIEGGIHGVVGGLHGNANERTKAYAYGEQSSKSRSRGSLRSGEAMMEWIEGFYERGVKRWREETAYVTLLPNQ